jgi:hypothetical protein
MIEFANASARFNSRESDRSCGWARKALSQETIGRPCNSTLSLERIDGLVSPSEGLKGPSRRYAAFDKVDLGQLRAFAKRLKQAVERANGSAGAAGSEGARATGGAGDG